MTTFIAYIVPQDLLDEIEDPEDTAMWSQLVEQVPDHDDALPGPTEWEADSDASAELLASWEWSDQAEGDGTTVFVMHAEDILDTVLDDLEEAAEPILDEFPADALDGLMNALKTKFEEALEDECGLVIIARV